MAPQRNLVRIGFVCMVVAVGFAAALLWRQHNPPVELTTGLYLSSDRALPDFSLIDQNGRSFGPDRLRGHWSFMFFGYTNCPDFCPTTLATLATLEKRLRGESAPVRPQVIFMSVDAVRDTPQQLAKYVPYFDPEFIGLTARDQATIDEVARKLGVSVIITPKADGTYTVDHSGAIFVTDPRGKLAAILSGPFTVDTLLTDFKRMVDARA